MVEEKTTTFTAVAPKTSVEVIKERRTLINPPRELEAIADRHDKKAVARVLYTLKDLYPDVDMSLDICDTYYIIKATNMKNKITDKHFDTIKELNEKYIWRPITEISLLLARHDVATPTLIVELGKKSFIDVTVKHKRKRFAVDSADDANSKKRRIVDSDSDSD